MTPTTILAILGCLAFWLAMAVLALLAAHEWWSAALAGACGALLFAEVEMRMREGGW